MTRTRWITIVIIVVVIAAAVFAYMNFQKNAQATQASKYQTVPLTKGDLTALVGATGTIRANQSTSLNWQTSGRVGGISVKEGDMVKGNAKLAWLAPDSLPQSLISAQADLVTAQRSLDDLKTSGNATAQAQLTLAQAQKAYDDAVKARTNKNYQHASQATINQLHAEYILAQQGVENAQNVYNGVSSLADTDPNRAQALSLLSTAEQKRDRALANYNYALARPDSNEVAQADGSVSVAKANLDKAQLEWDRLKNGSDPKDVAAAQARVDALQATLDMANLYAPITGTVTAINSMVGDQVSPATNSFRIDDLSSLLADVQITEVDINNIKVGQPAKLTFDAIPNKEYNGKVYQVGRVGINSGGTNGTVNFTVTIEMTDPDGQVKPGMTAAVNVVTNSIPDTLLIPNRAVRTVNGIRYVYIKPETTTGAPAGQQPKPTSGLPTVAGLKQVEVKLGATSDTYSQLLSGDVKVGDQIVLNPPSAPAFGPGAGGGARPGGGGGGGGGGGAQGGGG